MSSNRAQVFTDIFCKLTLIPKEKVEAYLETGTIGAMIEHPQSLDITKNQLEKIEILRDIYKFYERATAMKYFDINQTKTIADYLRSHFPSLYDKEHMIVGFLDNNYRLLGAEVVSTGTLNASIVHPRDVFREAIKYGSSNLILAHNHPSGDTNPSREDISVTYRLEEVGKALNIKLLDHLIVGPSKKYFSFRDNELIDFRAQVKDENISKEYSIQEKREYKKSLEQKVELLNRITKIPKTKLKKLIEDSIESIHQVFRNPEKYDLTPDEVGIIKDLNTLRAESYIHQDNYHNNKFKISSPMSFEKFLDTRFSDLDSFKGVAFLDTKNSIIDCSLLKENTSTKSALKDVLKTAFNYDSNSIIIFEKSDRDLMTDIIPEVIKIKSACNIGGISLLDSFFIDSNNTTISLKQEDLLDSMERPFDRLMGKKTIREITSIAKDLTSSETIKNNPIKYKSKEL